MQVENETIGEIQQGLVLLVCFEQNDDNHTLSRAVNKIKKLRIFDDTSGKMNLNIQEINGEILSISQFTLSWDGSGGHRPSFENSMNPAQARLMYALFNKMLKEEGLFVEEGKFGTTMKVSLINDGPVTFNLQF